MTTSPQARSEIGSDPAAQYAEPHPAPALIWDGPAYSLVESGAYRGMAIRSQGPEQVRRYGRWGLLVEFVLENGAKVCAFYNLGRGQEPRITHRGKYFQHWCIANGGLPGQGEDMSPRVFIGRAFLIKVRVSKSGDYSLVSEIESTEGIKDSSGQAIKQEAIKQEAIKPSTIEAVKPPTTQGSKEAITQGSNHPRKQGSKEPSLYSPFDTDSGAAADGELPAANGRFQI
jgi:hypothetical protein